jgi:negative regulator of sigma-B (phosphoserine phosphatase)
VTPRAEHASRPKPGEIVNGDRAFSCSNGLKLVAGVVDGLGHGPRAEEAALLAVAAIEGAVGAPVEELVDRAHRALRGTRGAAVTIVTVDGDRLETGGVGNVALRVVTGTHVPFVPTPGIVGSQMRKLRIARVRIAEATRLALQSDGISSRVPSASFEVGSPEEVSRRIVLDHASPLDDATVLVLDLTPGDPRTVRLG